MRNKVVPWIGTLGIDETSLHKMVRVISSAAICGMSFSFIIGEAVDYRAKDIHNWKQESRLIPAAYLPLNPITALAQNISFSQIGNAVLAANTKAELGGTQNFRLAANLSFPKQNLARPPLPAPLPEAPIPAPVVLANNIQEAPLVSKAAAPILAESELEPEEAPAEVTGAEAPAPQELSAILSQVELFNFGLNKEKKKSSLTRGAALVSTNFHKKENPSPAAPPVRTPEIKTTEHLSDQTIIGESPAVSVAANLNNEEWLLRGRIVGAGEASLGGHFEIGLFAKVDQDGLPVGYPLVQQILKAGTKDFALRVPAGVVRGYLYGEFVESKQGKRSWIAPLINPVQRGDRSLAELPFDLKDAVISVASSASRGGADSGKEKIVLRGRVNTMFASAQSPIPQEDVVVKLRGRKESTRTNGKGEFSLTLPKFKGAIQLEFLKAGYHPRVSTVTENHSTEIAVDIASRQAVERLAIRMGIRQLSAKGVIWGRLLDERGKPLPDATVKLNGKADGPYYFAEDGNISADRKQSSRDGRFVFFNLESGVHLVESSIRGETIAPFMLSSVEGGEFIYRDLQVQSGSLSGRLFNPLGKNGSLVPLPGARVRVEGESDFVATDAAGNFSFGAIKWMRGEKISLDVSLEKFNNHRYLLTPTKDSIRLDLYALPAIYLGRLAQSMDLDLDRSSGIVLGKVNEMRVRVDALAEHSQINPAKDFYFDARGKLKGSHSSTDPKFGTYVIFNVPKGNVILHGQDGSGALKYGGNVVSSPTAVSVVID